MSCCCGPPGRNRTVIDRLSGGCTSLVLRAEKQARGEQGIRTPRPESRATRLADGHLAPVQDGLSNQSGRWGSNPRLHGPEPCALPLRYTPRGGRRGSRTLKAHRSSVFETVAITHWLALPEAVSVGRVGIEPTSYGLRDRCNASICYRPASLAWPHPSESNRDLPLFRRTRRPPTQEWEIGVSGDTPRPQLCSCQRSESRLRVPDPGVEPRCRGSEPRVLPLDQSGSAEPRAARARLTFERRVPLAVGPQGVEPRGSLWTTRLQRAPASLPV